MKHETKNIDNSKLHTDNFNEYQIMNNNAYWISMVHKEVLFT